MGKDLCEIWRSWHCGANFIPSNAINQLEMWQAESFDPVTIDRELGWAASLGMDVMRVYLHDLLYQQDARGFLARMEEYLTIASRHGIGTVFVFFDDCWNYDFQLGKQPDPRPYTHNSGWIQSPGGLLVVQPDKWGRLKSYVQGVMGHFAGDARIWGWDLYNEPGNGSSGDASADEDCLGEKSLAFLQSVFDWAEEIPEHQPITSGVWSWEKTFDALNREVLRRSEVVSFHCYGKMEQLYERISVLRFLAEGRALLCTEYMARPQGSTFANCLPLLKKMGVGAIHWGLVAGKTNTIYPWNWSQEKGDPELCFHDLFNSDGSLLYEDERRVFQENCF